MHIAGSVMYARVKKYTFRDVVQYLLQDARISMHFKLPILLHQCPSSLTLWIPIIVHKLPIYDPKMLKNRELLVHVKVMKRLRVQGVNGF